MKTFIVALTIFFTLSATAKVGSCDMPLAGDKIIVKGGTPIYGHRKLNYVPTPSVFLDLDREVTVVGAKRVENKIFLLIMIEDLSTDAFDYTVEQILYEDCKW